MWVGEAYLSLSHAHTPKDSKMLLAIGWLNKNVRAGESSGGCAIWATMSASAIIIFYS